MSNIDKELREETHRFLAEIIGYYQVSPSTHLRPKKTLRMILGDHDKAIKSLLLTYIKELVGKSEDTMKHTSTTDGAAVLRANEPIYVRNQLRREILKKAEEELG